MRNPCIRPVDSDPAKRSQLPKATLGVSSPHSRFSQTQRQRGSAFGIDSLRIRHTHVFKNLTEVRSPLSSPLAEGVSSG